ncbi:MAG TPA: PAS domain-containing sensor histidine kinase [Chitinophagales bacterium]|nr:PAS domain-containing sensor histidine kinase [Chitinophagales bacterium]
MKKNPARKKAGVSYTHMADSEGRWRSIFENMRDTIMTVNRKAVILSINHVQQGFTKEQVIGSSVYNFVPPDRVPFFKKSIAQLIKTGKPFEVEDYIQGPDGTIAWYYSVYSPILDSAGYVREFMIITRNITTMKKAEHSLLTAMFDGQEAERKRVSRELHDGLGQNISAIRLYLLQLEEQCRKMHNGVVSKVVADMHNLVLKASDEVRAISLNLAPPRLEEFGLIAALEDFCRQVNYTHGLKVKFTPAKLPGRLSPALEMSVYRITQELLTNVIKHAKATRCAVKLAKGDGHVLLIVSDNGKGYNTARRNKGLGLQNIQARVNVHKGYVVVKSVRAKGTTATIGLPAFA